MHATTTLSKYSALVMNFMSLVMPRGGRKVQKVPSKDHSKSTFKSVPLPSRAIFFKKNYKILKIFINFLVTYAEIYGFYFITSFY